MLLVIEVEVKNEAEAYMAVNDAALKRAVAAATLDGVREEFTVAHPPKRYLKGD